MTGVFWRDVVSFPRQVRQDRSKKVSTLLTHLRSCCGGVRASVSGVERAGISKRPFSKEGFYSTTCGSQPVGQGHQRHAISSQEADPHGPKRGGLTGRMKLP